MKISRLTSCHIECGNALDVLRKIPDGIVHSICTSPPYFGLRDYGHPDQIGQESSPEEYVQKMVSLFREARRVLHPTGTVWLNLGDSYSTKASKILKPKDLIGIPWKTAFALQQDRWWLRQDIIWSKPNPMPSCPTDRCVSSHEYLFLLTAQERYYFDSVAIQENSSGETRNKRSVWNVPVESFKGSHFAVWPTNLVRDMILAGTSDKGCCSKCYSPYRRILEKERTPTRPGKNTKIKKGEERIDQRITGKRDPERHVTITRTLGWEPTCSCNALVIPCLVLDLFNGSGTTGIVSLQLRRRYLGIELNPDYVKMSNERIKALQRKSPMSFLLVKGQE